MCSAGVLACSVTCESVPLAPRNLIRSAAGQLAASLDEGIKEAVHTSSAPAPEGAASGTTQVSPAQCSCLAFPRLSRTAYMLFSTAEALRSKRCMSAPGFFKDSSHGSQASYTHTCKCRCACPLFCSLMQRRYHTVFPGLHAACTDNAHAQKSSPAARADRCIYRDIVASLADPSRQGSKLGSVFANSSFCVGNKARDIKTRGRPGRHSRHCSGAGWPILGQPQEHAPGCQCKQAVLPAGP